MLFFFGLGFVGWISGHPPFTCCKRALAGAVIAYIAAVLVVKAINAILINAMISSQQNQAKGENSGGKD